MSPEIFEKWEHIVENVDKTKIPVEFIKKLVLKLNGKRQRTINIQNLIKQGLDSDQIESAVSQKLKEYDDDMISIEFVLDIKEIADTVQPQTDNLLRHL